MATTERDEKERHTTTRMDTNMWRSLKKVKRAAALKYFSVGWNEGRAAIFFAKKNQGRWEGNSPEKIDNFMSHNAWMCPLWAYLSRYFHSFKFKYGTKYFLMSQLLEIMIQEYDVYARNAKNALSAIWILLPVLFHFAQSKLQLLLSYTCSLSISEHEVFNVEFVDLAFVQLRATFPAIFVTTANSMSYDYIKLKTKFSWNVTSEVCTNLFMSFFI